MNNRRLIIVVDFDNDVGRLGNKTPIIGYDAVFKVATEYALTNPQDSDLNVLFTALKLYHDLKKDVSSGDIEVALVAGDSSSSIRASIKVSKEVEDVLEVTKCNEAIVVVDSVEDESVLPIIQSKVKVVGVERVVVEQLRGVEETYVLLGRYLRKVLEERRFSKVFLGLPGFLILTYSILTLMNLSVYATPAISLLLAAFLIFKGFGIDDIVVKWWRLSPITRISLVLSILSIGMTSIIFYMTLLSRGFSSDIQSIAFYIGNTLPYIIISFMPLIVARITLRVIRRSIRVWRDLIMLVIFIVFYNLLSRISEIVAVQKLSDMRQVLSMLAEYRVVSTFFLYIIIIMSVSAILYIIEKRVT